MDPSSSVVMCLHSRLLFLDSVFVGYECRDVNDSVLCTGF